MAGSSAGLRAPEGYWWCLGRADAWHLLPVAEIPRDGPVRGRTACGLWPSLVIDLAWRRVAPAILLDEDATLPVCSRCAHQLRVLRERDRLVTPPAAQGRLL